MLKGIQVRVDAKLKKDAEKILEEIGLDMPTAIRVFLKKLVKTKRMPFSLDANRLTENGFTPEQEEEILEAMKGPSYGPFKTTEEMFKHIEEGKWK
jgi:DNA-damage-inducible protein J